MSTRQVRIGGASAFITDSTGAARQLLGVRDLDDPARREESLPWIGREPAAERVGGCFRHVFADPERRRVERCELPGLGALDFLLHEALGGGGLASLRVDPLAKGMAQQLLDIEIPVPAELGGRA